MLETLICRMETASEQSRDDILSGKRSYPLPVCRWAIGSKLMDCGYPSTKVSKALGIDHATLLYGRKKLLKIKEKLGWTWEIEIITKFEKLCS